MRVAPSLPEFANWQLQYPLTPYCLPHPVKFQTAQRDEEGGETEKLVAPTKSLPFTCVRPQFSVYHLKSCSGDKKLYCHGHNLRDLHG